MESIELANQAELFTTNVAYKAAMDGVRQALVQRLEECPIGDKDLQHEIALSLQLLKQLDRNLRSFIMTGELERKRDEAKKWYQKMRRKVA